jgi:hypothetical protein
VSIVFIYDETSGVPDAIRRIIGAGRFGDIVRRKRRLVDSILASVQTNSDCEFVRLLDESQLPELIERIQKLPGDAMLFRLPSSVVPLSTEIFAALIEKLPYALNQVVYGEPQIVDAPALLYRDSALALLSERDQAGRRRFFSSFGTQAQRVGNQVQFVDISDISPFLAFMSGATEARHFNSTVQSGGVFRKRSRDKAKMRGEYRYFHIADEAMKRFLLPTFDYVEDADGATYAMEHLSVPDAAIQIVHNTFNEASFGRLLDSFLAFIAARSQKQVGAAEVSRFGQRDIVEKLDRRIEQLLASPVGQQLDGLLSSAGPHGSLGEMVDRCRRVLTAGLEGSRIDFLALGHGDPCFSNILYNSEINLFRLIDPRGAENREDAFVHPLYDLAKFSHSVLGGYDFVNGGLAECRLDAQMKLTLVLDRGGPPAWMKTIFRARLAALGWDLRLVRAIEASLFLSMLPLHIDSPEKLPAFCLIAGEILAELDETA